MYKSKGKSNREKNHNKTFLIKILLHLQSMLSLAMLNYVSYQTIAAVYLMVNLLIFI